MRGDETFIDSNGLTPLFVNKKYASSLLGLF
jgi:hypothetical protein